MFPLGSDYRPTRAEMEGRQAPPPPDVLQRSLSQAGDGVLAAWEELEEALGRLLTGAPREAALPCLLATAALHALHTRLALVGRTFDSAHAPVEARASPLPRAHRTVLRRFQERIATCTSAAHCAPGDSARPLRLPHRADSSLLRPLLLRLRGGGAGVLGARPRRSAAQRASAARRSAARLRTRLLPAACFLRHGVARRQLPSVRHRAQGASSRGPPKTRPPMVRPRR